MLGERHGAAAGPTGAAARKLGQEVAEVLDVGEGAGRELRLERVTVPRRLDDVSLHRRAGRDRRPGRGGRLRPHGACSSCVSGQRRPASGRVLLPGGQAVPRGLRAAIGAGVALVSGDRRRFGLMLDKPLWENIGQVRAVALARDGVLIHGRPAARAGTRARRAPPGPHAVRRRARRPAVGRQPAEGRVRQVARRAAVVLLLDDPTRGVDVGAKAEMHVLIRSAGEAGAVVLLASTDVDELAAVCDRVVVFFGGRVCAVLAGDALAPHALLEAMNTGEVARAA